MCHQNFFFEQKVIVFLKHDYPCDKIFWGKTWLFKRVFKFELISSRKILIVVESIQNPLSRFPVQLIIKKQTLLAFRQQIDHSEHEMVNMYVDTSTWNNIQSHV